jgi:hypothetical protein
LNEYNEATTLTCEKKYSQGEDGLIKLQARYDEISQKILRMKIELDQIDFVSTYELS